MGTQGLHQGLASVTNNYQLSILRQFAALFFDHQTLDCLMDNSTGTIKKRHKISFIDLLLPQHHERRFPPSISAMDFALTLIAKFYPNAK